MSVFPPRRELSLMTNDEALDYHEHDDEERDPKNDFHLVSEGYGTRAYLGRRVRRCSGTSLVRWGLRY